MINNFISFFLRWHRTVFFNLIDMNFIILNGIFLYISNLRCWQSRKSKERKKIEHISGSLHYHHLLKRRKKKKPLKHQIIINLLLRKKKRTFFFFLDEWYIKSHFHIKKKYLLIFLFRVDIGVFTQPSSLSAVVLFFTADNLFKTYINIYFVIINYFIIFISGCYPRTTYSIIIIFYYIHKWFISNT